MTERSVTEAVWGALEMGGGTLGNIEMNAEEKAKISTAICRTSWIAVMSG
jgi:hypothetical protein